MINNFIFFKKKMLNKKIEKLFFKLDQIVNICFEDEKQDFLPSNAILKIIKETNEKDLGSLKASVNLGKKEVHKNLKKLDKADVLITDTWESMGEKVDEKIIKDFKTCY